MDPGDYRVVPGSRMAVMGTRWRGFGAEFRGRTRSTSSGEPQGMRESTPDSGPRNQYAIALSDKPPWLSSRPN